MRTKYSWETFAKEMIEKYPQLEKELAEKKAACIVPPPNETGVHTNNTSRPTENAALRELPPTKQKQYDAVSKALDHTERMPGGADRLKLIDLMYWQKRYKLHGAAMQIPCSFRTAIRWHSSFIRLVGFYYGLLDEEEWGKF